VGERGIYHGRNILENGTQEEIDACDAGAAAITTTSKAISARDHVKLHKEKPRRNGARCGFPSVKSIAGVRKG